MPILQMRIRRLKFSDCLRLVSQPLRGAGSNSRLAGSSFLSVCQALHRHYLTGVRAHPVLTLRPWMGAQPSCTLPGPHPNLALASAYVPGIWAPQGHHTPPLILGTLCKSA